MESKKTNLGLKMSDGLRRECIGELVGTWVLMVFGLGVNAQVTLSGETAGSFLSINLGWGLAVTMGGYVAAQISGAHLNPAITMAMAVFGKLPVKKVIPYIGAQMAGAFLAAVTVYFTYREAIGHFDGGVRQVLGDRATAGIFATYPQSFLSTFPGGFVDQLVGTALFSLCIFALTDKKNRIPQAGTAPVLIGGVVLLIGMTFGFNAGYAINPARDFGPRLFTALAGWGPSVFTVHDYWFWVPLVVPCIGAVVGGLIYQFAVQRLLIDQPAPAT
jgi:MIP family channel proteins